MLEIGRMLIYNTMYVVMYVQGEMYWGDDMETHVRHVKRWSRGFDPRKVFASHVLQTVGKHRICILSIYAVFDSSLVLVWQCVTPLSCQ